MTDNVNEYYLKNRNKIIDQSLKSYYKQIGNMNETELKEYRKLKSIYFKKWYQKNRDQINEKRYTSKRYTSKPKINIPIKPRKKRYTKIEYEFLDHCDSIDFSK